MEQIHSTEFATYFYDRELKLLVQQWHNPDEEMTDLDYKLDMLNYLKFVRELDIKRALINLLEFNYTIAPDIQTWVDTQITRFAVDIVHSIAFVLPENLFIQVSVKQVMREENAKYENIDFFTTFDKALDWLKQH